MKARYPAAMLCVLVACKGSDSKCPEPSPTPAPAPQKPVEQADTDPDFVHVDRDQLEALCLSANLPPVTYPSDHGALSLADGKRVPWLTVWVDDAAGKEWVPPAKEWTARASDSIKSAMSRFERPTTSARTGHEWRNVLCDGAEAYDVVTTGVFFEKKSFRAFAMRGDKLLEEELPPTTERDAVFRKAFELTVKLVGQPATIASHKLGGTGEALPTVSTDVWVAAASKH